MISFIHSGDLHLGLKFNNVSFGKEIARERRRELWQTFQRIVEEAAEKEVDFLFLSGDIFENKYMTLSQMKRLRDILSLAPRVNILIIAGNHDYIDDKSFYGKIELPENVIIFQPGIMDKKEFPHLDSVVYGYSWDRIEMRDGLDLRAEDFTSSYSNRILLLHGDIAKESSYLPLNLDQLKSLNMSYIALGHIHKPQMLEEGIAYCGSPEPLDFGELGPRGIVFGRLGSEGRQVELIPFSKRQFWLLNLELTGQESQMEIEEKIKSMDKGKKDMDLYRIVLEGLIGEQINLPDMFSSLEEDFYYVELIDRTDFAYDLAQLEEENESNIIENFIREMKKKDLEDPRTKQSLYYGLRALMEGRK